MFLSIRTDQPDASVGLYSKTGQELSVHQWHADRQLSNQLLKVIHEQLQAQKADWPDLAGVIVFEGPGSFTGLRIGITVANALSYGQSIPIVSARGDDWAQTGLERLLKGQNDRLALPHYGAEAHITAPRK